MALLLCVDYVEHEREMYFIPDQSVLPKNLLAAIEKMHGVYCNTEDFNKSHHKPWDYICAAMTVNPDHLEKENTHNQNRFAHKLLPYRMDIAQTLEAGTDFVVWDTKLKIIQTGSC